MEYIKGSIFIEKDIRIFKRIELLNWIEKKLNIKRFEINRIQLNDNQINEFIQELSKLTDLLPSIIIFKVTNLNQIKDRVAAKLNKLTKLDQIQKFVADLYNRYDDIISYKTIVKKKRINKKQIMLTNYANFELNKSIINHHNKFINKIGSDNFVLFNYYI